MMMDRRDVLAGLGCVGAFAAAKLLRPRHSVSLMPGGGGLNQIVPRALPGFVEGGTGNIIIPANSEGSLASRLYDDQLGRIYRATDAQDLNVMLLVAYGAQQTDTLQLHRPESCYPAFGFSIQSRRFFDLPVPGIGSIPAVALSAVAGRRVEDVIYWSRIGTRLPRTSSEQRWTRLQAALRGEILDGTLVRASAVRHGSQSQFAGLERFLGAMLTAVAGPARAVLVGR